MTKSNDLPNSMAIPTTDIFAELMVELKQKEKAMEPKMILSQKHAEEIFWLNRRIHFLAKINEMIHADELPIDIDEFAQQFVKINSPQELISRLKEIYGTEIQ